MTPQEVIKEFMQNLTIHNLSSPTGEQMLDLAVKATSKFSGITDVITQFKNDQKAAELQAIKEVLTEAGVWQDSYDGKQLSEIESELPQLEYSNVQKYANVDAYYYSDVANVIRERSANIFLESYCGIQLNSKFWIIRNETTDNEGKVSKNDSITHYTGSTTGNTDTGAITGSDANITLKAGEDGNYSIIGGLNGGYTFSKDDLDDLVTEGIAVKDGNNYVVGTGKLKTESTIVPEYGNLYTANTNVGQIINTGNNDWIIQATDANDVITSGGIDSIDAKDGNDIINVNANDSTITTGEGNDTINISKTVNRVTLTDITNGDTLNIGGTFKIQSAKISGNMLIITDTSGDRIIKISNPSTAKTVIINGKNTLNDWLNEFGFDIDVLIDSPRVEEQENADGTVDPGNYIFEDIVADDSGRAAIDEDYTPTKPNNVIKKSKAIPKKINVQSSDTSELNNMNIATVDLSKATVVDSAIGFFLSDGTFVTNADNAQSAIGSVSYGFPDILDFNTHGLNMHYKGYTDTTEPDNATYISYNDLGSKKSVISGLYQWWVKEPLNLIYDTYGIDFNSTGAMAKDMYIQLYQGGKGTLASAGIRADRWYSDIGVYVDPYLVLNVNMYYYDNLDLSTNVDGDGKYTYKDSAGNTLIGSSGFLDRTIAHEFTHSIMQSNVKYFSNLPQFLTEGIAELTHGIDDERGNRIFALAGGASDAQDRLTTALSLSSGTGENDCYAAGYMLLRYFARHASLQTLVTPAESNITATVNLSGDGDYKVSGDSKEEVAKINEGSITLGNAAGKVYTVNDNVEAKQIINTSNDAWTINNVKTNVTVKAGNGNDVINGASGTYYIDGGGGNDKITVESGSNLTLIGGDGDDTIDGKNTAHIYSYVQTGSGNDSIDFSGQGSTIDAGSGNNSIKTTVQGRNLILSGEGKDTVVYRYDNNTIKTGDGDDSIVSQYSKSNYNNIDAGAGNDIASIKGNNNTVHGGDGNDTINISESKNEVYGDDGDDIIKLDSTENTVFGGTGNDSIYVRSDDNTINSGAGNDTIKVDSGKSLTITDFNASDIIQLTFDPKNISFSNNVLTIDNINITLPGLGTDETALKPFADMIVYFPKNASVSTTTTLGKLLNITEPVKAWTIKEKAATYTVDGINIFTLTVGTSFKSNLTDSSIKDILTVSAVTNGYKISFNENKSVKDIVDDDSDDTLTLAASEGQTVSWDIIPTVNPTATFNNDITITENNVTFKGTSGESISKNGNVINYTASKTGVELLTVNLSAGSFGDNATKVYDKESGKLTINLGSNANIANGATLTVVDSLADGITVSSIELLKDGSDPNLYSINLTSGITNDGSNNAVFTISSNEIFGWIVDNGNDSVSYGILSDDLTQLNTVLLTISGLSTSGLSIDRNTHKISNDKIVLGNNNVITLSNNVLNQDEIKLTVNNNTDYKLALAGNIEVKFADPVWTTDETQPNTAIYSKTRPAGYSIDNNRTVISYNSEATVEKLVEITGIKSGLTKDELNSGIVVSNDAKTFTLSANVLGTSDVSVTFGSVTLALASDVSSPQEYTETWEAANGTVTYKAAGVNAGYKIENNTIVYTPDSGGEVLNISGLNSNINKKDDGTYEGISLNNSIFTLSEAVLGGTNITLSGADGYTLALDVNIKAPQNYEKLLNLEEVKDNDQVVSKTAIYKSKGNTTGYTLNEDKKGITYTPESGGDPLFTITGLAANTQESDLSISDTVVTLKSGALSTNNVTISEGYTLALDESIKNPTPTAAWAYDKENVVYIGTTSAGYTLSNDNKSVIYTAEVMDSTALITITGLKEGITTLSDVISVSGTVVTLKADALNQTEVNISDGYTLALDSEIINNLSTETKSWLYKDSTATFSTNRTQGYFLSEDSKKITYIGANGESVPIIEITNLKSQDNEITGATINGVSVTDKEVTISESVLGTDTENPVTITDGYTLKLVDGVTVTTQQNEGNKWSINEEKTTATYQTNVKTAGYQLVDNTIKYLPASSDSEVNITGLNGLQLENDGTVKGIEFSGTTFTLSKDVLPTAPNAAATSLITLTKLENDTNNYSLALDDDVAKSSAIDQGWYINVQSGKATAVYNEGGHTAGFEVDTEDSTKINYNLRTGDLVTIGNLPANVSDSDLIISTDKKTVTLGQSALAAGVEITNGAEYKLVIDEDYLPQTIDAHWSLNDANTTAAYSAGKTAGYIIDDNKVTYSPVTDDSIQNLLSLTINSGNFGTGASVKFDENDNTKVIITLGTGANLSSATKLTVNDNSTGDNNYISKIEIAGYTITPPADITDKAGSYEFTLTRDPFWTISDKTATYNDGTKDVFTLTVSQIKSYVTATNIGDILKYDSQTNKVSLASGKTFNDLLGGNGDVTLTKAGSDEVSWDIEAKTAAASVTNTGINGTKISVNGRTSEDIAIDSTNTNKITYKAEIAETELLSVTLSAGSFGTNAVATLSGSTLNITLGTGANIANNATLTVSDINKDNITITAVTITRASGDSNFYSIGTMTGNATDGNSTAVFPISVTTPPASSSGGGTGNGTQSGGNGDDTQTGGNGDDTQTSGNGDDTQTGGNGDDTQTGSNGDDTQTGGNDDDTQTGSNDDDTRTGSNGDDTQTGGNGDDSQTGGNGDDTQTGGNGDDTQTGSNGDDTQTGGNGDDTQTGGNDDDTQTGGNGDDTQTGGNGEDTQSGGTGDDTQTGGSDYDTQTGGNGDDTQTGGIGNDTQTGGNDDDPVTVIGGGNEDSVTIGGGDDDSVTIGGNDDSVTTIGGNDDDSVTVGGSDDDSVIIGGGDDSVTIGGSEDDSITVAGSDDSVTIIGGDDSVTIGGNDDDSVTTIGGNDDDSVTIGGNEDSVIVGGDEDSVTIGGNDDDSVTTIGGSDEDSVTIGGNDDSVTIIGGGDDDSVTIGGNDDDSVTVIGGGDEDSLIVDSSEPDPDDGNDGDDIDDTDTDDGDDIDDIDTDDGDDTDTDDGGDIDDIDNTDDGDDIDDIDTDDEDYGDDTETVYEEYENNTSTDISDDTQSGGSLDEENNPSESTIEETLPAAIEEINNLIEEMTNHTNDYETIAAETTTDSIGNLEVSASNGNAKTTIPSAESGKTTTADYSSTTGKKEITTGTGNQVITVNDEGGNVVNIDNSAGSKTIQAGNGGDIIINVNTNPEAEVTIKGGSGNDTIVASGSSNEYIELGGGEDVVVAANGANVNNYDVTSGAGFILTGVENLSEALITGSAAISGSGLIYNENASLNINKTASDTVSGTFVNIYTSNAASDSASTSDSALIKVGWADSEGQLDASSMEEAVLLIGNSYNDTGKASTIVASAKDNTIFAGVNDVVSLNGGADLIIAQGGTNIENYDHNTGAGIMLVGVENIAEAIRTEQVTLSDTNFKISKTANDTVSGTFVNIYINDSSNNSAFRIPNSELIKVGWADSSGQLDASTFTEAILLIGSGYNDSDMPSTITTSAQDDTVFAGSGDVVNLTGGADIIITSGNVQLENYSPTTGAGLLYTNYDIVTAINLQEIKFGDSTVTLSGNEIKLSGSTITGNLVNLYDGSGNKLAVAWTREAGGLLEASEDGAVMVGNYTAEDGAINKGKSTLKGGSGNDTIFGGSGDEIQLSAGNDNIILSETTEVTVGTTLNLESEAEGTSTVSNFNNGFEGNSDKVSVTDRNNLSFSFVEGVFKLTNKGISLIFGIINKVRNYLEKPDETEITETSSENTYKLLVNVDGEDVKMGFIGENATISGDGNKDVEYYGLGNSAVDFASVSGMIEVDDNYHDIASVIGGDGETTLTGTNTETALVAGRGATTIIAATDTTLFTYNGIDKNQRNTFAINDGSSRATIAAFDYGSANTNDVVKLSDFSGASVSGNDIYLNNGTAGALQLKDGKNEIIQGEANGRLWTVEFGDDLVYNDAVEMYGNCFNESNKLTLSDENATAATAIYMNGKNDWGQAFDGKAYYNVNNIDASGFSKDASIAGADYENDTITGGKGNNSLWGGLGGNDLLKGGEGTNTYFYLFGDGEDTISGAKSGDVIELWNITLDDINFETSTGDSKQITIKFNDGGSLRVTGDDLTNVNFKLGHEADGNSTWHINADKTWSNKK